MKKNLPIGIQDFSKIIEGEYKYIDKTGIIHQLIAGSGVAFFISRPRRFGKSLLCSTLGAIFEGKRELFTGLAIESLEWEWKKHPVIHIDLNPGNYSEDDYALESTINRNLEICANKYDVLFKGDSISDKFARLIYSLNKKYNEKVVVIIDEYDKPLVNTLDNKEMHITIRSKLKSFYGILKPSDEYLKFVLLTGVSKFSQVSIFSDLNHLVDLTLDTRYADICGITQEELEDNFEYEINTIIKNKNKNRSEYLGELRGYYNGYRFSKKDVRVYNPFGLLNHFDKGGEYLPYWYETGTPTFLLNLINSQKINILELNELYFEYEDFQKFDIENLKAETILYQVGYLIIKDFDDELNQFILDFPNNEVRTSFAKSLLEYYFQSSAVRTRGLINELPRVLIKGDIDAVIAALKIFLSSIPYDIAEGKEKYYQTAIHLIFTILGLNCRSEVRIASGRIDTLVETKNNIYCFEFKLNGTAEEALAQVDTKDYLLPWKGSGKKIFKIGINFDHEKRNIGEWKYELNNGNF